MNIANWLWETAKARPEAPALLTGERIEADYSEFARRAGALARWLREERRVRPGDRVALFLKNRTEYLEALYAIWWAGAVAVPINAKLLAAEAAYIVRDAGARELFVGGAEPQAGLFGDAALLDVSSQAFRDARSGPVLGAPAPREAGQLAWLFYTSGTTGKPKGVMLSHGNLMAMSEGYLADVDAVTPACATLYAAPMSHGAGLYNFVFARQGGAHVCPASGGFDAAEVLELAERIGEVSLFAAPTMVKRLAQAARERGATGEGLRLVVYGGGPMYLVDIREALQVMGPRFAQIYGQGESPMTITVLPREAHVLDGGPAADARLASVGRAQRMVEVRVVRADGRIAASGEEGEVQVKGPTVMSGYWGQPSATAETLKDGWLLTGDVGRLDEAGYLTLTDRTKDVIISGGTNIYPREVEEALLSCPGVREAAVVGAPDAEWGEAVCAFVVTERPNQPDDEALTRHCLTQIARFKRPRRYVRLRELPTNNYGKVLKTELRRLLTDHVPAAATAASGTDAD